MCLYTQHDDLQLKLAFSAFINCTAASLLVWALGCTALVVGCLLILTAGLLSTHRPHLQIVLGPLALTSMMITCLLYFAAYTHVPWLAKHTGSLWNNAAIAIGMQIHHTRQKPHTR